MEPPRKEIKRTRKPSYISASIGELGIYAVIMGVLICLCLMGCTRVKFGADLDGIPGDDVILVIGDDVTLTAGLDVDGDGAKDFNFEATTEE